MKIFLSHSRKLDYQKILYVPIKNSELSQQHQFIFPGEMPADYKIEDVLAGVNLVLAEASVPSIKVGIELGIARSAYIPILCIHQDSIIPSDALRKISNHIYSYPLEEGIITTLMNIFDIMGYRHSS